MDRTESKSDTWLTHSGSGFDLGAVRQQLIAKRVKHGADTPIGHRCSNLIEQLTAYETVKAYGAECEPLDRQIMRSMSELAALTK